MRGACDWCGRSTAASVASDQVSRPEGPSLRELRGQYYEKNGLPPDGGEAQRWVRATSGRIPLYFLNTAPRRRAVPYHDLHHVLTCYDTSSSGEAEISAWELAAGTRPHWIAALLDLAGMAVGLFIAPRRTFRAFVRGRRCSSLYGQPLSEALLASPAEPVRVRLGLDRATPSGRARDVLAFAALGLAGLVTLVGFFVLAPLLLPVGLLMQ